jgi:hypothetical protein
VLLPLPPPEALVVWEEDAVATAAWLIVGKVGVSVGRGLVICVGVVVSVGSSMLKVCRSKVRVSVSGFGSWSVWAPSSGGD